LALAQCSIGASIWASWMPRGPSNAVQKASTRECRPCPLSSIPRAVNFINTVSRSLKAGTVWVNCYNVYENSVPFGGYKSSGGLLRGLAGLVKYCVWHLAPVS
jgi:hypothetical protein